MDNLTIRRYGSLPCEAIQWLACGQRGRSSETILSLIYGLRVQRTAVAEPCAPTDPEQFRECRLLVDGVPGARTLLLSIADVHAMPRDRIAILRFVERWDVLCGVMNRESSNWASTPSARFPRLHLAMRELWREIDDCTKDISDVDAGERIGEDRLDPCKGLSLRSIDRDMICAKVDSIMEQPIPMWAMPGKAALRLFDGAAQMVAGVAGWTGSDAAHRARLILADRDVQASLSTGLRDESAARRGLFVCMGFLWREGGLAGSAAEAVRAGYLELKRDVEAVADVSSMKPGVFHPGSRVGPTLPTAAELHVSSKPNLVKQPSPAPRRMRA